MGVLEKKKKLSEKNKKVIFSGSFWLANEAKDLGLIDGIASESSFLKVNLVKRLKLKNKTTKVSKTNWSGINSLNSEDLITKLKEEFLFNKFGI